jgi:RNA recognition motif-containing protein
MNIYVSNLDLSVTSDDLKKLFAEFGNVASAEVQIDMFTGKSRGFAFVEMVEDAEARKAIASLQQKEVLNQPIKIEETKPREEKRGSYKVGSGAFKAYRFKKD